MFSSDALCEGETGSWQVAVDLIFPTLSQTMHLTLALNPPSRYLLLRDGFSKTEHISQAMGRGSIWDVRVRWKGAVIRA